MVDYLVERILEKEESKNLTEKQKCWMEVSQQSNLLLKSYN